MAQGINTNYSKNKRKEEKTMAKRTQIAGNAVVITSQLKLKEIKTIEKFCKESLCLTNQDEEEIFRISTGDTASISKYGITFAEANKDGFAQITTLLPEHTDNKKEFVKENYAVLVGHLIQLETQAKDVLGEINKLLTAFEDTIEEVQ